LKLSKALEANCRRTALERGLNIGEPGKNNRFITSLFRLVDCANPVTDFEGEIVIATPGAASRLEVNGVRISAVEINEVPDGPENIKGLATYDHLKSLVKTISDQVQITVPGWSLADRSQPMALELYTCFPVVPLAFLWAAGWAKTPDEMLEFLARTPITLSGGMNFARAPWNNPALRGVILAARAVKNGAKLGIVHGNGGLGGRQGVCVLQP